MSRSASWTTLPLAEVAQLKTGPFGSALHKSDYVPNGTPIINPMHIIGGRLIPSASARVGKAVLKRLSEFKLVEGDVVLGRRGEMGRCAVVDAQADGWLCGTGSLVLRPMLGLASRYLQRFLSSPDVVSQLQAAAVGSTMVNLNQGILRSISIPVPPVNEQERIADKLDQIMGQVQACRQRLDRVPAILDRFRQSVLAAATTGELTREWRARQRLECARQVRLDEVASGFNYGSAAKSSKTGKVPVLRMGNIQNAQLDWADLVYTSDNSEIEKYALEPGDVLFNRTNSPELVGKSAVFRGERAAIYAGYLIRVKCGDELLPDYLNYCLASPAGRQYYWKVKSDGVSQSNINASKLAAFSLLLPSVVEQHEIVRQVNSMFAKARQAANRVASVSRALEQAGSAVLSKAFRGELVPQDPNDEPADALLARIRQSREANATPAPKRASKRRR